jgi:hypothetical protein
MKKTQNKEKITLNFLKGDQFAHQKVIEKNTFLALTYSKIKIFFKTLKTDDEFNYLPTLVEHFFQEHISMHQKVQKKKIL